MTAYNGSDSINGGDRNDLSLKQFGHAMVVIGYSDDRNAFKIINSWGTEWCDGGYGWLDYNHFNRVVRGAYRVKDAPNGPSLESNDQPMVENRLALRMFSIKHNVHSPRLATYGLCIEFIVEATIPDGIGKPVDVVIQVFQQGADGTLGNPIKSRYKLFSTPQHFAATGALRWSSSTEWKTVY